MNANKFSPAFSLILAEFKDKRLEEDYFRHEMSGLVNYIRTAALILGILFFLFIIPDYFLTSNSQTFQAIFFIRASFMLLIIILYVVLGQNLRYGALIYLISVYKLLVSIAFLLIFYLYESPNFFVQSFGVVILILAFFLVVNRWLNVILISLFLGAGFMFTANLRFGHIPASEYAAVGVYITLVITMSAISSYRTNYYKRLQFAYNKELVRTSEIDALTGIYAKGKFNTELNKWVELAQRYQYPLSLVLFDVDDFKKINDHYGHIIGDQVLASLAAVIKSSIRESDVFARWGGDEFAILLPYANRTQAHGLAERIRMIIATSRFDQVNSVSCSFGVASYKEGDDSSSLMSRADYRLLQAKSSGKNKVV
ncbi:MAG TPA: GGDEF domain-containing protein [Bacillota bacterium]|nr:GGDEF domain-containing protein [Bacillota bacterium]